MADSHNTFAFRLARRTETRDARANERWQARKGPSVAGCTGIDPNQPNLMRDGTPLLNPDGGNWC
jgi:hypothetical protein